MNYIDINILRHILQNLPTLTCFLVLGSFLLLYMLILNKNSDLKKYLLPSIGEICTTLEGRGERVWGVN